MNAIIKKKKCCFVVCRQRVNTDLPRSSPPRVYKTSVTRCPRGQQIPSLGLWKGGGADREQAHAAMVRRKWCSASPCLDEHWLMKRGGRERKGVCLQGTHGPRVPMQPGRLVRWCRNASSLLTCHAAAMLSSPRFGHLSFFFFFFLLLVLPSFPSWCYDVGHQMWSEEWHVSNWNK